MGVRSGTRGLAGKNVGRWVLESLTILYRGIKDGTVSASLPSTSHTCEIPQFNGKDINHLQQHICLKRRHQHLPDIFPVVLLIVHLLFFLWFVTSVFVVDLPSKAPRGKSVCKLLV